MCRRTGPPLTGCWLTPNVGLCNTVPHKLTQSGDPLVADDALFAIATPPVQEEINPLLETLGWGKTHLGRFLGVSRTWASRWAHGHVSPGERAKAAFRFLQVAAETEATGLEGSRRVRFLRRFGEWAHGAGIRGLVYARFRRSPEIKETSGPLPPSEIYQIRQDLGWIQAEMAAFFGITHSTPAKWENLEMDDPRISPATEAELIALREHAAWPRVAGPGLAFPNPEEIGVRRLWQAGVSGFMTSVVGWEQGIFPDR